MIMPVTMLPRKYQYGDSSNNKLWNDTRMNMKKYLAVGVLILFISTSVIPSTGRLVFGDDTEPPFTTHSIKGEMHNGIYYTPIIVTLNATDNESGVNVTYLTDGGGWKVYTEPFTIAKTQAFNFAYYSVDNAGNREKTRFSPDLLMDIDPPEVTHFDGREVIHPMGMRLYAICDDYGSGCDYVEFYDNGELKFTDYGEPFEYEWDWIADNLGMHTLRAVVYDRASHSGYREIIRDIIVPFPGERIVGFINNPVISDEKVSFFAILAFCSLEGWFDWKCCILDPYTFSYYEGYIGKHFVSAKFWGQEWD
jgi:hypothetical protein